MTEKLFVEETILRGKGYLIIERGRTNASEKSQWARLRLITQHATAIPVQEISHFACQNALVEIYH